jgi:hypothetical protein
VRAAYWKGGLDGETKYDIKLIIWLLFISGFRAVFAKGFSGCTITLLEWF